MRGPPAGYRAATTREEVVERFELVVDPVGVGAGGFEGDGPAGATSLVTLTLKLV